MNLDEEPRDRKTAARAVKAAGRCFSRPLGVLGTADVANMGATFVGSTQTQILGRERQAQPVHAFYGAPGTETATVWNGYMDGAVQAGKWAAAEALAEL